LQKKESRRLMGKGGIMLVAVNASLFIATWVVFSSLSIAPSRIWERFEKLKVAGCVDEPRLQERLNESSAWLGGSKDEESLMSWISAPVFHTANITLKVLLVAVSVNLFVGILFLLISIAMQFFPRKNQRKATEDFSYSPPPLPETRHSLST